MKFSNAVALIATSMSIPATWASPVDVGLESRNAVVPPSPGQVYRCDTSGQSPGQNALQDAAWTFVKRKGQTCRHSNSKGVTQMYNRNGARIIAGGKTGNFDCAYVGYVAFELILNCVLNNHKAGGASYKVDQASGTWVSVSKQQ
ncbi:hypothetical protein F4779DRAFT_562152 [Xylariaceae sp. FL0662B]|nr:hypothetical protein F4779DRAFT_562152 [Xylariaceae sp. FL0662B]